ncbi:MAG: PIN domain-containing protein [Acidimicrobiia bacterium]
MKALLLDTTFLIDAERSGSHLEGVLADDDDVAIAAITVAELLVGVRLASGRRKSERAAFVDDVVSTLPIVAYDLAVAQHHSELLAVVRQAGRPRGAHDLIIAATARSSRRVVVTTDAVAFEGLPGVTVRSH